MKRALTVMVLLACAAPVAAQTKGRVSVGVSVTYSKPTSEDLKPTVSIGPLVRLNPKKGWGPAAGFSWLNTDIEDASGNEIGSLRTRPVMGGVAYTVGEQPVLVSFSVIAGPSFNRIEYDTPTFIGTAEAKTSIAVRPGVGVTFTLAPRFAIVGFGGFIVNRPEVTFRAPSGQESTSRWKADAALVSAAAVVSLF